MKVNLAPDLGAPDEWWETEMPSNDPEIISMAQETARIIEATHRVVGELEGHERNLYALVQDYTAQNVLSLRSAPLR